MAMYQEHTNTEDLGNLLNQLAGIIFTAREKKRQEKLKQPGLDAETRLRNAEAAHAEEQAAAGAAANKSAAEQEALMRQSETAPNAAPTPGDYGMAPGAMGPHDPSQTNPYFGQQMDVTDAAPAGSRQSILERIFRNTPAKSSEELATTRLRLGLPEAGYEPTGLRKTQTHEMATTQRAGMRANTATETQKAREAMLEKTLGVRREGIAAGERNAAVAAGGRVQSAGIYVQPAIINAQLKGLEPQMQAAVMAKATANGDEKKIADANAEIVHIAETRQTLMDALQPAQKPKADKTVSPNDNESAENFKKRGLAAGMDEASIKAAWKKKYSQ